MPMTTNPSAMIAKVPGVGVCSKSSELVAIMIACSKPFDCPEIIMSTFMKATSCPMYVPVLIASDNSRLIMAKAAWLAPKFWLTVSQLGTPVNPQSPNPRNSPVAVSYTHLTLPTLYLG